MALRARTRSTRSLVLLLVTISLITITLDYRQGRSGPLAGLGRVALSVMTPLQDAVSKVLRPVGDFLSAIGDLPSLRDQNERLRDELAEARRDVIELEAVRQENEDWQALFRLRQRLIEEVVGARVIASGVSNFEWTITIDVGSADGVRVDMPVLAPEGLAGRVVEVTSGSAQVQLIIDPDANVGGEMLTTGVIGLLEGDGDDPMIMSFVDPDAIVDPGAPVVTAGYEGGVFPPNIPIGQVTRVLSQPNRTEQRVEVSPYVDFSTLDNVLVVLTPDSG